MIATVTIRVHAQTAHAQEYSRSGSTKTAAMFRLFERSYVTGVIVVQGCGSRGSSEFIPRSD